MDTLTKIFVVGVFLFTIVLAGVITFFLYSAYRHTAYQHVPPNTYLCSDSDGGMNRYIRGKVAFTTREWNYPGYLNRTEFYEDVCADKMSVVEYFCGNGNSWDSVRSNVLPCPYHYICMNGACVKDNNENNSTNENKGYEETQSYDSDDTPPPPPPE